MSNKLFRKGLVVAALTGLAATVVAAPAHAAGEIVIAPSAGTSYSTFADQSYNLVTSFAPGVVVPNVSQLKYKLTRDAGKAVYAVAANGTAGTPVAQTWTNDATVINASASLTAVNYLTLKINGAASTDATTNVGVTAWVDSNNNDVIDSGEWQAAQTVTFKKYSEVSSTTAITAPLEGDTSATAKVSFVGVNNEQLNKALAGGTFTKGDGTSIVGSGVAAGGASVAAASGVVTVTATNNFKVGQLVTVAGHTAASGDTGINGTFVVLTATSANFTYASAGAAVGTSPVDTATTVTPTGAVANIAWSSTDSFAYTATTSSLVKDQAVKFAPAFNGVAVGSAATALITARSVSALTAAVVSSNSAAAGTTANSTGSVAGTATLAKNGSFSAYAKTVDTASTPAAIAGKTVSYSVVATKLPSTAASVTSSTATLTINGVTYTNQAALPGATGVAKLTGVTGADGKIAVTGSTTNYAIAGDATDNIVLSFSAENFAATLTVTEAASAAASATVNFPVVLTGVQGLTSSTSVVAGTTVHVSVNVNDQFGNAVADNKFSAFATLTSSNSRTTAATATPVVAQVVGGTATLALPDNGAGTGNNVWSLVLRAVDATTGAYGATTYPVAITGTGVSTGFNASSSAATAFTVNLVGAADLVAGKVTLATGSGANDVVAVTDSTGAAVAGQYKATAAALATADFAAYDGRNPQTAAPAGFVTGLGTAQSLTATVYSASTATYAGVSIPSASVTYALKGAQFSATIAGQEVDTVDSITVPSGSTVSVWSHIAGAQTVTVTSGAASSTVIVTFPVAATGNGTAVNISAPATAVAGTTIAVVVTVVDKFGNPVLVANNASGANPSFKLTISGIGAGASVDTTAGTDALVAGTVTKYITIGAADSGTLAISATYDKSISDTTNAVVTATASVKVGAAAVASLTSAGASAQAQTGSAVSVSATAKDAAGAAVKGAVITFTATGAAYLSSATATTDANGVATVKLIGNVAGDNSVVASANGTSAAAVKVAFGNSDASLSAAGKRVTAAWSFAAGKKVVISVNGARVKSVVASSDAADSFSFNAKKGTNKVTVSVAGVVTDALTVKVKK